MYVDTMSMISRDAAQAFEFLEMTPVHTTAVSASQTWQQRASAAYDQSVRWGGIAIKRELAAQLSALLDRDIRLDAIAVNEAQQFATIRIDGVLFRMQRHELTLVRPCTHCGTGYHISDSLATLRDLGYAMYGWEPHCEHCEEYGPSEID